MKISRRNLNLQFLQKVMQQRLLINFLEKLKSEETQQFEPIKLSCEGKSVGEVYTINGPSFTKEIINITDLDKSPPIYHPGMSEVTFIITNEKGRRTT